MCRELWRLVLVASLLGATAAAQEIVIEPTNGRANAARHATSGTVTPPRQPAAQPAQPVAHPPSRAESHLGQAVNQKHTATRKPAKKAPGSEGASNKTDADVKHTGTAPTTAPAMAKNEGTAVGEASGKALTRPDWAMQDTRDASSLQSEIASALARDPRLRRSAIEVKVDGNEVTLEGRAPGSQERLQAERLAQSYAWNRRLVDHIQVAFGAAQQ